jgi:diaminopimelate decarboxylase
MTHPADPIDLSLLPRTAALDAAGRLSIAGVDAEALAGEFGTPLYVYDETDLRARCREYVEGFPGGVAYAAKAFLCGAMARLVVEEGLDLDVASQGELAIALAAGVPPDRITMHGNNKSDAELRGGLEAGAGRVVVDSDDELDRIARLAKDGLDASLLLVRVNPGIDAHTHEFLATGVADAKFGFAHEGDLVGPSPALAAVQRILDVDPTRFGGLHCHIGSQILGREAFDAALERLASLVGEIEALGVDVPELNVGGGLGIRYVAGDAAPTIATHAAWLHESFGASLAGAHSRPRLTTEPGRSIAGPAGVTLYRAGTVKEIPGVRTYVSVDGGLSDNPRPALYGARYEIFAATRARARRDRTVTIAGAHCEQGDLLVRDAAVPDDLAVGDLLCVPATGAYGHSMASNYNAFLRPAVVFVRDGVATPVVRRETVDDLLARDLSARLGS